MIIILNYLHTKKQQNAPWSQWIDLSKTTRMKIFEVEA